MGTADGVEIEAATFADCEVEPPPPIPPGYASASRGLLEVSLAVTAMVASGVVGNAAWAGVKLALSMLNVRLTQGSSKRKRKYVGHIAQLSVAAKLPKRTRTELVSCKRKGDIFFSPSLALTGKRTECSSR